MKPIDPFILLTTYVREVMLRKYALLHNFLSQYNGCLDKSYLILIVAAQNNRPPQYFCHETNYRLKIFIVLDVPPCLSIC